MRIAYVLLSTTFGMHQYTADIANRMAASHEVHLVTSRRYPQDRYQRSVDVKTPISHRTTGFSPEGLRLDNYVKVIKAINQIRPDIVHISGPHLWNIPLLVWLKINRIPSIHTIHDLKPHSGINYWGLLPLWNRLVIKLAGHILLHGERFRRESLENGVADSKLTSTPLLHLFLSYVNLKTVETAACTVKYEPFALFFGRLAAYKGFDDLVEVFSDLADPAQNGQQKSLRLEIAGEGEVPNSWLDSPPSNVNFRNRIIDDAEAIELFRRCGLVVLPYRDATQTAIIAAAYYFRKPVLVTDVGALAEYVQDGQTGAIIAAGNKATLRKSLITLLSDPQQLRRLGEAGRTWYDRQRVRETDVMFDMYERIANR